jgi:hypothetical protein
VVWKWWEGAEEHEVDAMRANGGATSAQAGLAGGKLMVVWVLALVTKCGAGITKNKKTHKHNIHEHNTHIPVN